MGTLHHAPVPEKTGMLPLPGDMLRVSEEEYWETYYEMPDITYEWNNGVLEERPMGDTETFLMYDWFYFLLREYLKTNPVGDMIGMEVGFRLAIPGNTSVRRPDLALILKSNPVRIDRFDRSYGGIFDVCFEFVSDSKPEYVIRDTVTKKTEYCQTGVKEYFILDRKGPETAFYQLQSGFYTPIRPTLPDGVICSRVLPGFQFREEDLYLRPSEISMAEDQIYRSFVLKDYQEERQGREKAEQRAEKAEQQAQKERQQAQKLAAMLRELGINAD